MYTKDKTVKSQSISSAKHQFKALPLLSTTSVATHAAKNSCLHVLSAVVWMLSVVCKMDAQLARLPASQPGEVARCDVMNVIAATMLPTVNRGKPNPNPRLQTPLNQNQSQPPTEPYPTQAKLNRSAANWRAIFSFVLDQLNCAQSLKCFEWKL